VPELPLEGLSQAQVHAGRWAAAAACALAREEQLDRRPRRLLEPGHATWQRFRGRLGWRHLLLLQADDAAAVRPVPFDAIRVLPKAAADALDELPDALVHRWLGALEAPVVDGPAYLQEQAKRLGLPTRMARSELHKVKPHHRVLELPGTGGQLAHHVATTQPDIFVQDVFTVACDGWEELVLAGLVALELRAPSADFARIDPALERVGRSFDFVFGLHPDKGGRHTEARLREVFAPAEVVLV
jgi:hypothetical protein